MTSTDFKFPTQTPKRNSSTMSFGAHRQMDVPASAVRAGASTMPRAWQTRGAPVQSGHSHHGAPAKSLVEIFATPFRRVLASKTGKIAFAAIVCMTVLTLIF